MGAAARPTPLSPPIHRPPILQDGSRPAVYSAALSAILPAAGRLRCHWLPPPVLRVRHAGVLTPRAQLQEDLEAVTVSSADASVETKNVHVKFTLKRECLFGQQFFVVGNDPNLGLWDTSSAIPLEWSEGHVWTAQLDLPVGKSVKYKFILRGLSGEIEWQPGEDRVLQPWETTKMIVVTEEWENAEKQNIAEEEEGNNEEPRQRIAEEQGNDREKSTVDEEPPPVWTKVFEDGSPRTNETSLSEGNLENFSNDKFLNIDADNENIKQKQSNDKAILVPGLPREFAFVSSLPSSPVSKAELSRPSTSSTSSDKLGALSKDWTESTLKGENKECTMIKETPVDEPDGPTPFKDQPAEANEGAQESLPATEVVRNDIQWGRETLNKFLSTLGLFQGESA